LLLNFIFYLLTPKFQTPESEFTFVKEEADGQISPGKSVAPEDYLYMKVRETLTSYSMFNTLAQRIDE